MQCKCGCGRETKIHRDTGLPNDYCMGHSMKGKKRGTSWNKGKKGVQEAWNKGLTKETDERMKQLSESVQQTMSSDKNPNIGRVHDEEWKRKQSEGLIGKPGWSKGLTKETDERMKRLSESMKGIPKSEYHLKQMREQRLGDKNWNWTGTQVDWLHAKAKKLFGTGKCEMCGMTEEEHLSKHGCGLHMHNTLVPKDYTVMTKDAWKELCKVCHKTID